MFLEFSGLVLDRVSKVAYVSLSTRCHRPVAELWAKLMNYELIVFRSYHSGEPGSPEILHTNRVLQIGTGYALFCGAAVKDEVERKIVLEKLKSTGHRVVIDLSLEQLWNLCGQCHEVQSRSGDLVLAMSTRAYNNLTQSQRTSLQEFVKIIHAPLDTLEKIGGGSVSSIINDLF